MVKTLIAIIILSTSIYSLEYEKNNELIQTLEEIQSLVDESRFLDVIQLIYELEENLQKESDVIFHKAYALLSLGNRAQSKEIFQELWYERNHKESLRRLAVLHFDQREWVHARDAYSQLVALDGANVFVNVRLAQTMNRLNDHEEALKILEPISENYPTFFTAKLELATAYISTDNDEQARDLIGGVLESRPQNIPFLNLSGQLYYKRNQFLRAAQDWKKIIELQSPDNNLLRNIALSFYRANNEERALYYFEMILEDDPEDLTALMYAAIIFRNKHMYDRAEQLLDWLYEIQITQSLQDTLVQRAFVKERIGDIGGARSNYELLLSLKPDRVDVHYYLGNLLEKHRGYWDAAVMHYQLYLDSGKTDPILDNQARARIRNINEQRFFEGELD